MEGAPLPIFYLFEVDPPAAHLTSRDMVMAPSRGIKRTVNGDVKSGKIPNGKIVNFDDSNTASKVSSTAVRTTPNLKQRATDLLATRRHLPIWGHGDEIRSKIRSDDVLLLVGETGSGKSTQIPQFLVDEVWCRRKKLKDGSTVGGCIAITEPRRVAAISLAKRVAEEMGMPLGTSSPASQVGYSVRFDNSTGPATRIKFLTEGMMLQEMLRDPWLKDYSAVVVDEVHERGLNVDLVLGFLRRMQQQSHKNDGREGSKIKVVIMSATADMEKIQRYFEIQQSETNGHVASGDEDEWNGFSDHDEESSKTADIPQPKSTVSTLSIKGRQHPVTIQYAPAPVPDILEATLKRVIDIHTHAPLPGDILVFLTGQETVESLLSLVEAYSISIRKDPKLSDLPALLILPLYAALPPHLQQRVFERTPNFTRKIIISTNIAETSITVPGIRHVIDCGKHKRRLFRPSLNLDSLLTVPISRSSANQRSGRAGRDAPGQAYRLYTEASYYGLAADTEPEILRCDLSQLVLILKAHGIDNLDDFPLLTQPPPKGLERAIVHLLQLSALHPTTGAITPLGWEMSLLPLPSHLARILLSSSLPQYSCVDEMIDIVSALSVENIFLNIHNQTERPTNDSDSDTPSDPRLELRSRLHRRNSDHLTLLAVVQVYVEENSDRKRWCEERGISHRAMQAVMDARKQLTNIMKRRAQSQAAQTKKEQIQKPWATKSNEKKDEKNGATESAENITASSPNNEPSNIEDLTTRILKTLLTGLHPNVARLSSLSSSNTRTSSSTSRASSSNSSAAYLTLSTNQPISIHPSSLLFTTTLPSRSRPRSKSSYPTSHSHSTSHSGSASEGISAGSVGREGGKVRPEAIMSSEYVYTTKAYARCVSAVQMDWVVEAMGLNAMVE